jgi:hypothetical protein
MPITPITSTHAGLPRDAWFEKWQNAQFCFKYAKRLFLRCAIGFFIKYDLQVIDQIEV